MNFVVGRSVKRNMFTRALVSICLVACLTAPAFGQAPSTPSTFDIADVHVSDRQINVGMTGGVLRAGRYELHNATMVDLIRTAYGVDSEKVMGGPNWLELDRYTVVAQAPASTSADNVKLMLRALLAERFKLAVHEDTRPLTVFAMTLASGKPKMTEASGSGPGGCQPQPPPQPSEPGAIGRQTAVCRGMTMAAFAQLLPRAAGAYLPNPVVDLTGLQGAWDFEVSFTARPLLAQAGADGISLFDALEKQLGLKLELKTTPTSALVVDSVERKPTANSPEVAKVLPPPPPPEFEVATIKPTSPEQKGTNARIQPTGMVNVVGMPLKTLISLAWDLNSDELIDAPKWTETARFDLVARAFASTTQTDQPPIEIDTLRQMLRTFLIERFQIKTHVENREVSGYLLSAPKPRLTKADPSSRTRCTEGPAANAADPRNRNPILSRLITCQNMTMAQFAERLQSLANGYVRVPALDATGLEGGWTFTVNFSPVGVFQGLAGRGGEAGPVGGGAALAASEPTGALSLPEALDRQLGLKLELQKRPLPVLVFDHIAEKPIE
jgi:uncharacterized protein (TIGR03435 family)